MHSTRSTFAMLSIIVLFITLIDARQEEKEGKVDAVDFAARVTTSFDSIEVLGALNPLSPVLSTDDQRKSSLLHKVPRSLHDLPLLPEDFIQNAKRGFALRPVLIVPSLIGSALLAKLQNAHTDYLWCLTNWDEWFYLYMNTNDFTPPLINCWLERIAMRFDTKTHLSYNATGVPVVPVDYGGVGGVEYMDADKKMGMWNTTIELLKQLGYIPGENLRAAPYDWRVSPLEWPQVQFPMLKGLFEEMYVRNGNMKIAAVSLSMGGPYFLDFLNNYVTQEWKDKYIHSWTSMDGAFGGSTSALAMVTNPGGIFGSIWSIFFELYGPQTLRTFRTWPTLAFMLPFGSVYGPNAVFVTVNKTRKSYSTSQFIQLLNDAGGNTTAQMLADIEKMGYRNQSAPGVPVHCVFGFNISTPHVITYDTGVGQLMPTFTTSNGDGTVLEAGLDRCAVWAKQQKQPSTSYPIANMFHGNSMHTPEALGYFIRVLFTD